MNQAIKYVSRQLNNHLKQLFGLSEDIVIVSRLVDSEGSIPMENQNKLVLSMVNITTEMNRPVYGRKMGFANDDNGERLPLLLNTDLLLAANFQDELEAAKFLTAGIQFFHEQPVLSKGTNSDLPSELDKVTMEICTLSLAELDALWSAIGTSMIPSAMYRMRTIQTNS